MPRPFRPRFSFCVALGAVCGLLLGARGASAQAPDWVLYNAGNAPIANDIREIRQEGSAMWVLGPLALYRHQSGQWTTFALSGSYVNGSPAGGRALHIDGRGTKWVGTSEETLRLDGQGAFATIGGGMGAPPLRYDDDIVADPLGNLFFVSAFDGLYRYDGTAPSYVFGGGSRGLRRMIISGSTYWFTTASELVRYEGNQERRWYLNPTVYFTDLRRWNNLIWIASEQGMQRFSPVTNQFLGAVTPANSPLPSRYVNCVLVDSQNALWAGTAQGLARYDGTAWQVFTSANSPLPVDDVRTLFQDAAGNLWIGTATGGVAVYHAGGILGAPARGEEIAAAAFTIAPNPATTTARLHFAGPTPRTVTILDALGRTVRQLAPPAAVATWEVPLAALPA
ncbi:MAG: hypothetical protein H7335_10700, partial [Massilia sp.]|nr:hypothetical protein [Massilia sp.]